MRWLFHRKLVTPALMGLGLLAMLGGEVEGGGWLYAVAIAYWIGQGLWERLGLGRWLSMRAAARPRAKGTETVTVVNHHTVSDGVGGAFGRLHPDTQAWITAEIQARNHSQ